MFEQPLQIMLILMYKIGELVVGGGGGADKGRGNWAVLQTRTSWRGTGSRGSGRETELQQLNAGSLTMERRPSYRVYQAEED